jgi:glycosyltransferase involved in cell wall biosynthesis
MPDSPGIEQPVNAPSDDGQRVLWVSIEPAVPASSGGRLRSLSLLQAAAEHYSVTLVQLFGDPPANRGPLATMVWVTIPAGRAAKLRVTPRLVAARRPPYLRHFSTPRQRRAVERCLELHDYALVVADTPYAAAALPRELGCPLLIVTHNVEAEVWRAATAELSGGRALRALDRRLVPAWERATLAGAAAVAFCSARDRGLLAPGLAPGALAAVVPNAVDTEVLLPLDPPGERREALFIGGLGYGPNREAALFIRDRLAAPAAAAGITLLVAGGEANDLPSPPRRTAPHACGSVEFLGRLDDVRPAYLRSYATVVPLFSGGGTRLKVLESFAFGRPVVSTAKGVEGLEVEAGVHYLRAETAEQFVAQLTALRDPQLAARLSAAARALVEERYSWRRAGHAFLDLVEAALAR